MKFLFWTGIFEILAKTLPSIRIPGFQVCDLMFEAPMNPHLLDGLLAIRYVGYCEMLPFHLKDPMGHAVDEQSFFRDLGFFLSAIFAASADMKASLT